MDADGVIRENSAGYQAWGLDMLAMTFRCMTLLGEPVPASWAERYEAGLRFLDSLGRPDGTLPATGDTDGAPTSGFPWVTTVDAVGRASGLEPYRPGRPDRAETLDAAAGYWISWHDLERWPDPTSASQTVVTWAAPPARAHEHADEPSVLIWADGVSWLTSVGYWPYDDPCQEPVRVVGRGERALTSPTSGVEPQDDPTVGPRIGRLGRGRRGRAGGSGRLPSPSPGRARRSRHLGRGRPDRRRS